VIRGIVSALVADRDTPSSEELDTTRSIAEYFGQVSKGLTMFRAELAKFHGNLGLVDKLDLILDPYGVNTEP
jgi:hypothetical protein